MPPASAVQGTLPHASRDLSLGLQLGTEYERRKQKLKEELQLDFKQHVSQTKDVKTPEPRAQPEGLSLPIDDKKSVKEKLREERNKEYNIFLQKQAQIKKLKRGALLVSFAPEEVQSSSAVNIPGSTPSHKNVSTPSNNRPPSRRDAATLTEVVDDGQRTPSRGRGRRRGRGRWKIYRPREPSTSGEEFYTDEDEDFDFTYRRRKDRNAQEDEKWTHRQRKKRLSQSTDEVNIPVFLEQNSNDRTQASDLGMSASRSKATGSSPGTSKEKAELVTGLLIGATEEQTVAQRRKEQYKEELLRQIAEQQRNKIKEKKFELRVAATGVTDPEKEPNRIQHMGAVNGQNDSLRWDASQIPGRDMEDKGKDPNPRPKDDNSAGIREQNYFNEDYHRDFSNMLGQVVMPRVAAFDPPVPPILPSTHQTPYDAAYYYYGNRNPLDPNLAFNLNPVPGGSKQYENADISSQRPLHLRSHSHIEATHQYRASPFGTEEFPQDNSKQRRESILTYQEALKQQIKDRDEQRRCEKEERERYEAKIGAEMMAYNPWGKSGAGAPIKDQNGNIVSDFSQMYKFQLELLKNSGPTPGDETKAPLSHRLSGVTDEHFPQQQEIQNKYKEALKKQIEENKRKQAEERESRRIEEEKEEERLARERARMVKEYEQEQRKQKGMKQRLESQNWTHPPNEDSQENSGSSPGDESKAPLSSRKSGLTDENSPQKLDIQLSYKEALKQQIEENKRKQAEEKERRRLEEEKEEKRLARERLENSPRNYEKKLSPPIPTLRKKTLPAEFRPSSVESHSSSKTERTVSAPQYRPAPPETPRAQGGHEEVIRELSALRRYLRKEQQQLEVQMVGRSSQETPHTPPNRGRPKVDVFELAHREALQAAARSPLTAATHANQQNLREFNQLRHRDTASREEVRAMFPEPPTDPHSLDIQQQALLREQQREIRLLNRQKEPDYLDDEQGRYHLPRKKPENNVPRDPVLQSETTTLDFYGSDVYEEAHQRRSAQSSAKRRYQTEPRRRHQSDLLVQMEDDGQPLKASLQSEAGQNLKSEVRGQSQQHIRRRAFSKTEGQAADEEEEGVSLRSGLKERSLSVDSVATDLWLRPGTSEAVRQRRECRRQPDEAPPPLTRHAL